METIGRIGFWAGEIAYKLCTIKVSRNDGSIYFCFSFGTQHVNQGIAGHKITYHPDGNTWLTADLQEKIVGRKFIDTASVARMTGLSIASKGRVYVKGKEYELQSSFDEIESEKLVVRLKNGAEFFNIHSNNDYDAYFAIENNESKLSMTSMLHSEDYFGIRIDFFLSVKSRCAEFEDAVIRKGGITSFQYSHPSRDLTIFATIKNTTKTPKNEE
jgi:hypothetical protein